MNTGADVSYLLKARQALKASEDAERIGNAVDARAYAFIAMGCVEHWIHSMKEKEAA